MRGLCHLMACGLFCVISASHAQGVAPEKVTTPKAPAHVLRKVHRMVIQVDQNDPAVMNLACSPVQDRIKSLKDSAFPSKIQFSACNNTKQAMEKTEGHPINLLSEAILVGATCALSINLASTLLRRNSA
jgi:hypothetical protein